MFNPSFLRVRRFADTVPEIINLQREMNRLFSNVGQRSSQDFPAINIWEKGEFLLVSAELPGMEPDKIDISVSGDILTIAGKTSAETFTKGETYLRQERGNGIIKRTIQLPFQVNSKEVEAKYERGILTITLPRLKEDSPKKITISA